MENKVTLYIAEHNVTKKKYFGRTTLYFTEEELQDKYHGSGTYWKQHLKKHGDDVTISIYGIYDINEVEEIALKFSGDNDIVESNKWANLIPENGLTSGCGGIGGKSYEEFYGVERALKIKKMRADAKRGTTHSEESKQKMSESHKNKTPWNKGVPCSEKMKKQISETKTGSILTNKHKQRISDGLKGRKVSQETRDKISKSQIGKLVSDETRKKLSQSGKGKKHKCQITTCPYCGKTGRKNNMTRYHFDNCKNKEKQ